MDSGVCGVVVDAGEGGTSIIPVVCVFVFVFDNSLKDMYWVLL